MKKAIVKGRNYNFCIIADQSRFYIKASHVASLRFSFINNLNAILSEFDVSMNDKRISESQWIVSKRESNLFFGITEEFLSDRKLRDYLERKLDEDRECGEWENILKT